MKRFLPFLIIVVVLVAAVVGAWLFMRSSRQTTNGNANANANSGSPGAEPKGAEPPHVRGNASAPVTLEEFADFQCPSCGAYYPELKKIETEFGETCALSFANGHWYRRTSTP